MAILNSDLYGKMLNGRVGYILDSNKITTKGDGYLETFLNCCVSSSVFCLAWSDNTKKYIDKNEVRFLTFASYLTYVPYGNLGYKRLENYLNEKGINKSVADLRIEKFFNIMEDKLTNITKEEMDYIKRFFNEYKKESFNLRDNLDITLLVCNVNNEIEANYGSEGFTDLLNVKKILNEFCYEIANSKEERNVFNINEILLKIPKKQNLDEEELKHLLDYFNL